MLNATVPMQSSIFLFLNEQDEHNASIRTNGAIRVDGALDIGDVTSHDLLNTRESFWRYVGILDAFNVLLQLLTYNVHDDGNGNTTLATHVARDLKYNVGVDREVASHGQLDTWLNAARHKFGNTVCLSQHFLQYYFTYCIQVVFVMVK